MDFEREYGTRTQAGGYDMIDTGVRLYDVMWVLAIALNNTLTAVENGDINGTGCEDAPGSLVPLEQFSYHNERMGCLIQWNLQQTNFSGVSVSLMQNFGLRGSIGSIGRKIILCVVCVSGGRLKQMKEVFFSQ